jgi:hypothetical protein
MSPNFHQLIKHLASMNAAKRGAARMILLAMEEDAVEPLVAHYYAGATHAEAVAILTTLGEIGGPDALCTLRSVYDKAALKLVAALALLNNKQALSFDEYQQIQLFVRYRVSNC